MCRCLFEVVYVAVALVFQSSGFEVGAIVRSIDTDKGVAKVFANGQERTVKIAPNAKVLDENGKDLAGGIAAKELKADTVVTL
ncbi:MAG: hypothetical protein ABL921_09290, partial [Pirellula sp.]